MSELFKRLKKAHLNEEPVRCEFLHEEEAYFCHVITPDGVKPIPSKVDCIRNFLEHRNTEDIKSILGLSGYCRRFISNFAKISKLPTRLLQEKVDFKFDDDCRE